MLEEGNNALAERVNAQSHAIIQLWSKLQEKEAIDTVFDKTGIRLSFADPFGHVEEA